MIVDKFAQQIQAMHGRVAGLYREAGVSVPLSPDLLPSAFKELGTASEELQVAVEELARRAEELAATRIQLESERQHYQDLFEFLPQAYLISDAQGNIQQVNHAAATLLNVSQRFLVGKPLILFFSEHERRTLHNKLNQLQYSDRPQRWAVRLQPRGRDPLDATLTVVPVRDAKGKLVTLRWLLRDFNERQQALEVLKGHDDSTRPSRPHQVYRKGETIPLDPQVIWLVGQGLVKLSTVTESGEEVLVGLAGPSLPFGASLTALPTYQAVVISTEVQLISVSLTDIAVSPQLSSALFPQINERLRQTELLLAISGKRQIKDRLHRFLGLLKQEIGENVRQGTRLNVRFTHQELADACCTTRVTITRLLGKLQQQGKITLDSQHHIILIEGQE